MLWSLAMLSATRDIGVVVDHQLAEEMIYDADDDCSGRVSLDELIATLETVHIDESIDERVASTGAAEGGWLSKGNTFERQGCCQWDMGCSGSPHDLKYCN